MSRISPAASQDSGSHPATKARTRPMTFLSHIGGREEQQDACNAWENVTAGTALIVVCDGVGGSRQGGEASTLVVQTAEQLWKQRAGVFADPKQDLASLASVAHQRIVELAGTNEKNPPASTLTALYVTPTTAHWIHSGDSRIYRFRANQLISRTRDHSVVQMLVDEGELAEEDMGSHPDQGRLLQSLGTRNYREPRYQTAEIDGQDAFLLCTDGFWERTPVSNMIALFSFGRSQFSSGLHRLVNRAVRINGPESDNVTVAVLGPMVPFPVGSPWARWRRPLLIGGVAALIILLGVVIGALVLHRRPAAPAGDSAQASKDTALVVSNETNTVRSAPAGTPNPTPTPTPATTPPPPLQAGSELTEIAKTIGPNTIKDSSFTFMGMHFQAIEALDNRGYWMGETEVTWEQWNRIKNEGHGNAPGKNMPVANIAVSTAKEFARRMTQLYQQEHPGATNEFRLPTLSEWVWAAQGGTKKLIFPWGTSGRPTDFGNVATMKLNAVGQNKDDSQSFGLRDIVGNVSEWVLMSDGNYTFVGSNFREETEEKLTLVRDLADNAAGKPGPKDTIGFRLVMIIKADPAQSPEQEAYGKAGSDR